jgi:hypothetical protein
MSLADPASLASGRVEYDVHEFLATLGAADLLQITWRESGLQKGMDVFIPPLCHQPNTLSIGVSNRKEAFALRAAKIEIDNGNYNGAYGIAPFGFSRCPEPDSTTAVIIAHRRTKTATKTSTVGGQGGP